MSKTIALIDIDSLYYMCSKDTIQESISKFDEKLKDILFEVKADYFLAFNSNKPYFRNDINPEYKSNRGKYTNPLKWLKTLKKYSEEQYGVSSMRGIEADDLVAYWKSSDLCIDDYETSFGTRGVFESALQLCKHDNLDKFSFESLDVVVCSADKDVINLNCKTFDFNKWIFNDDKNYEFFLMEQMIIGDSADGIKGLPGKGKVAAKKIIKSDMSLSNVYNSVLAEYHKEYSFINGTAEFTKNYRCLKMLETNEEFTNEVGTIPTLPKVQVVSDYFNINNKEITF